MIIMKRIYIGYILLTAHLFASFSDVSESWEMYALFALGIVSVIFVYILSRQNAKAQAIYEKILKQQQDIEKKQNEFLHSVGEEIHAIVEDTYKEIDTQKRGCLPAELVEKEQNLKHVTDDLIEFLRLKSKKVEVKKERFNLNNVLSEVSGALQLTYRESEVELIYDIDNNIPRYLIGDPQHLERVLKNILEFMVLYLPEGEIQLGIETYATYNDTTQIDFKFKDNGNGFSEEEIVHLFTPYYDEKQHVYRRLGLFVAYALSELMGGKMQVYSVKGQGTTFTLTIPFDLVDKDERRYYHLPEKILIQKNIFIVDENYNTAIAIKKFFTYFKHHVEVMTADIFLSKKVKLDTYDLLIVSGSILTKKRIADYLFQVKMKNKSLKILETRSLFENIDDMPASKVADRVLIKPLTQERVFELIVDLYTIERNSDFDEYAEILKQPIHKEPVKPARFVNHKSFSDFGGTHLLVVDDDEINRKVISNILRYSGMNISFAVNGQEAVKIVKEAQKPFDMVLMDINMPVIDGYVATQMIRLEEKYNALPIVAFTALSVESERDKIFRSGMNAYLTKPINIGQLYAIFKLYMPRGKSDKAHWKEIEIISNEVIDMKKGILNVDGNEGLYMELLQEFLDAYGTSDILFRKLVDEYRFEQAKLLCIELKGLSNSIGANEFFHLLVRIHQKLLHPDREMLLKESEDIQRKFAKLKQTIETYLRG